MTTVDDVKRKIDIVDLVSETATLQKSGRNFRAPCPFHSERTPSFFVFPDRQAWHCFGACGTGGDIFSFVIKKEGVDFGEALRILARRAGIAIEPPKQAKVALDRRERLYRVNEAAARFFHRALYSAEGKAAKDYFSKRGVSGDTTEAFQLGYAPDSWDALHKHLLIEGIELGEQAAAGVVRKREDGSGYYDLFRNRLIFPISDEDGRCVGFGARAMGDAMPKYINSPQSDIFDKSGMLYGFHRAKESIKSSSTAVIVEGYMDTIIAHQYGFQNVVAPMGTALTEKQVGILKSLATSFVMSLDADAAGDEATLRTLETSWRVFDRTMLTLKPMKGVAAFERTKETSLKIMALPRGKDPDEVIKEDPKEWERLLEHAVPCVDYIFRGVARRFDLTSSTGKAAATERLAPLVLNPENVFEQNKRLKMLAEILNEPEPVVRAAVGQARSVPRGRSRQSKGEVAASPFGSSGRDAIEEYCLALLLKYPELLDSAGALEAEHFLRSENREIFNAVRRGLTGEEVKDALDESLRPNIERLLGSVLPDATPKQLEAGLGQSITRLEERKLKAQQEALLAQEDAGSLPAEEVEQKVVQLNDGLKRGYARGSPSLP